MGTSAFFRPLGSEHLDGPRRGWRPQQDIILSSAPSILWGSTVPTGAGAPLHIWVGLECKLQVPLFSVFDFTTLEQVEWKRAVQVLICIKLLTCYLLHDLFFKFIFWLHRTLFVTHGIFVVVHGFQIMWACSVAAHGMWGLRSPTRDQAGIHWVGRQLADHWATKEALLLLADSYRVHRILWLTKSLVILNSPLLAPYIWEQSRAETGKITCHCFTEHRLSKEEDELPLPGSESRLGGTGEGSTEVPGFSKQGFFPPHQFH